MKGLAAALALLGLVLAPASAQESHRALAERVVRVGFEAQVADRLMEVFWPVALQAIRARAPDINALQIFQYENKTMAFVDVAAHNGLVPLVDYFEHAYSEEELAAIAEFYASPAGIKVNGAQGAIASVLQGAAGQSLNAEVNGLRTKLDALLKADGL